MVVRLCTMIALFRRPYPRLKCRFKLFTQQKYFLMYMRGRTEVPQNPVPSPNSHFPSLSILVPPPLPRASLPLYYRAPATPYSTPASQTPLSHLPYSRFPPHLFPGSAPPVHPSHMVLIYSHFQFRIIWAIASFSFWVQLIGNHSIYFQRSAPYMYRRPGIEARRKYRTQDLKRKRYEFFYRIFNP